MKVERIIDPDKLPISLSLVLEDLGLIEGDISNELLLSYVQGAVDDVETDTDRALINQTWRLTLDHFPCNYYSGSVRYFDKETIFLPKGKFQSISDFAYIDDNNVEQFYDEDDYKVAQNGFEARVTPSVSKQDWDATTTDFPETVTIDYVAGYGEDDSDMPAWVTSAILLAVRSKYDGCPKSEAYDKIINTRRLEFNYEKNDR